MKLPLVAAATLMALLALAPAAGAAVKAKAALVRSADALVLEVSLTSTKAFTASTRPRAVKVGTVKLKRAAASRKAMTWRSAPQHGAAATKLEHLGGTRAAIKVTTRGGTRTLKTQVARPPAAPVTPAPPATTTPAPTAPAQPALTRNDAAGQQMLAGDLLLESASFGNVSAEYRRLWLMADGTFRLNVLSWTELSGERCDQSVTGTWAFKEGYTTDAGGGGVVVKIGVTSSAGSGDELLQFANRSPNAVFVGAQGVRYERNPHMRQNC